MFHCCALRILVLTSRSCPIAPQVTFTTCQAAILNENFLSFCLVQIKVKPKSTKSGCSVVSCITASSDQPLFHASPPGRRCPRRRLCLHPHPSLPEHSAAPLYFLTPCALAPAALLHPRIPALWPTRPHWLVCCFRDGPSFHSDWSKD